MKLTTVITILVLCFLQNGYAQKRQLSVDFGRSFNGTGDMKGLGFAVEYGKFLKSNIEFTAAIGANIHHSQYKILITAPGQLTTDASPRFLTAGAQVTGQMNLAIIRTRMHELKVGAGALLRYQASSYPDIYTVYPQSQTGIPEVTISFRQFEKQEIVNAGYLVSASYSFTFRSSVFIGVKAFFQNDTNGDVITQYGLRVGKRF